MKFEIKSRWSGDVLFSLECDATQHRIVADQLEALDMIFSKIARIINGDPNYADSWHDIAGYAKLIDDRLVADQAPKETPQEEVASKSRLKRLDIQRGDS